MNIIKKSFYNKLYLSNSESFSDNQMNRFLLCGDTNWDYYFDFITDNNLEYKVINNLDLLEFDNKKSLLRYLDITSNELIQDFTIEDNYFAVLRYTYE